jgi:tryptophan-rich sensory protein
MARLRIILSSIIILGAVVLSSFLVSEHTASWYANLNKPDFAPPSSVFAPTWIFVYILVVIAFMHVWDLHQTRPCRRWFFTFGFQLAFSLLWATLLFAFHALLLPMIAVVLLWLTVAILVINSSEIDRFTFWILVPYLAWVTFALVLSVWLWWIN